MQICWIKQTANAADVNVYNWLLFFVPTVRAQLCSVRLLMFPVLLCCAVDLLLLQHRCHDLCRIPPQERCVWPLCATASLRLIGCPPPLVLVRSPGLQATFRTRQRILFNGARYVGAFCFYWTCTGIIYFFLNRDSVDHPNVS